MSKIQIGDRVRVARIILCDSDDLDQEDMEAEYLNTEGVVEEFHDPWYWVIFTSGDGPTSFADDELEVLAATPRHLVVTCSGGKPRSIEGLPNGWTWEEHDLDDERGMTWSID